MNRNEEYLQLIKELEEASPHLQNAIAKARRREVRSRLLYRPGLGIAAGFGILILLEKLQLI